MLDIAATFLVLTALLAYINQRFIGLPPTIGVMGIALLLSLLFAGLEQLGLAGLGLWAQRILAPVDFPKLLLHGMLSLLLFAGALHIDLEEVRSRRGPVLLLAFVGTLLSTVLVAAALWVILSWLGMSTSFAYCLVFGALISPTDPIAVLGIMRTAGAPKSVETVISAESLLNDGVGVVLFSVAVAMLRDGQTPSGVDILLLFLRQAVGGMLFGYLLGSLTIVLLRTIDSYQEEVLITLAAVVGGYALADHLGVSGPLAMVIAGLAVGHRGRRKAMSRNTRRRLDEFWELLDALLNSVLFVLMGFEMVVLRFRWSLVPPTCLAILVVLAARWCSVALPVLITPRFFQLPRESWVTLTWGGLRGGISVALALSLPAGPGRQALVSLTYGVVIFSILVQGLTIGALVRRTLPCHPVDARTRA